MFSSPALVDGTLFVGADDGAVYALTVLKEKAGDSSTGSGKSSPGAGLMMLMGGLGVAAVLRRRRP